MRNKSVLVTGGAGFIGSHLVDRIIREEPENLIVVDNFFLGKESNLKNARAVYPALKVYNQDASDQDVMLKPLEAESVDVVFNLAVVPLPVSLVKPRWAFEQNVGITLVMCELAREDHFETPIHFSSSEAYGSSGKLPKVRDIFAEYFRNDLAFIDQIMLTDFSVKMPDDFLHVEDTMSMANSIEARVPLLDNELVELAAKIPAGLKYKDGRGKYIFRKAMEGILPSPVLRKEKRGFGGTVGVQFSKDIAEYANQLLPEGYAVGKAFVKRKYVEEVLKHKSSMNLIKHYIVIWDLLAFEIRYRMYMLEQSPEPKLEMAALLSQ